MISRLLLLLALILFCFSTSAQTSHNDSLRFQYNNQTIFRSGGWFLKGTERLSFIQLRNEFSMSELGLAGYEQAKKYRNTSNVFRYISLAASVAAVGVAVTGNNRNLAYGLLGGQMLTTIGAMRYSQLSTQSLDRALWQRNKDVLFPAQ